MGRPRLGTELKKPTDYRYNFQDQREIATLLTAQDIKVILAKTKLSKQTVYAWCDGIRRNSKIKYLAKLLSDANKAKLEMIEKLTMEN